MVKKNEAEQITCGINRQSLGIFKYFSVFCSKIDYDLGLPCIIKL